MCMLLRFAAFHSQIQILFCPNPVACSQLVPIRTMYVTSHTISHFHNLFSISQVLNELDCASIVETETGIMGQTYQFCTYLSESEVLFCGTKEGVIFCMHSSRSSFPLFQWSISTPTTSLLVETSREALPASNGVQIKRYDHSLIH